MRAVTPTLRGLWLLAFMVVLCGLLFVLYPHLLSIGSWVVSFAIGAVIATALYFYYRKKGGP